MKVSHIELSTKQDLEIYMSPVRQRLLRELDLAGAPQTPKALSLRLGVSPSSVQHHLAKLLGLGVVKVDHTERINGITATYYAPTGVSVRIGSNRTDCRNEREALAMQVIQTSVQGYFDAMHRLGSDATEDSGYSMTGIVHLSPEDWARFRALVSAFLEGHSLPGAGTSPYEIAVLGYRAEVGP